MRWFSISERETQKSNQYPLTIITIFGAFMTKWTDLKVIYGIRQKIDRISEDYERRFTGRVLHTD